MQALPSQGRRTNIKGYVRQNVSYLVIVRSTPFIIDIVTLCLLRDAIDRKFEFEFERNLIDKMDERNIWSARCKNFADSISRRLDS